MTSEHAAEQSVDHWPMPSTANLAFSLWNVREVKNDSTFPCQLCTSLGLQALLADARRTPGVKNPLGQEPWVKNPLVRSGSQTHTPTTERRVIFQPIVFLNEGYRRGGSETKHPHAPPLRNVDIRSEGAKARADSWLLRFHPTRNQVLCTKLARAALQALARGLRCHPLCLRRSQS